MRKRHISLALMITMLAIMNVVANNYVICGTEPKDDHETMHIPHGFDGEDHSDHDHGLNTQEECNDREPDTDFTPIERQTIVLYALPVLLELSLLYEKLPVTHFVQLERSDIPIQPVEYDPTTTILRV